MAGGVSLRGVAPWASRRGILKKKEKVFLNSSFAKRPRVPHMFICSTMVGGD